MKTEIELKPCPFCGEKAILSQIRENGVKVCCGNCGCATPRYIGVLEESKAEKEMATQVWNNRTFGWISVKDRLPETRNPVLVTNEYGDFYLANCSNGIWTEHSREKANFISVTHWMPIPEPPEMNGE